MSETNVLSTLRERGFVEQVTDEAGLAKALESPLTCYVGYDPTARSLHAGNLVTIMALAHLQRAGHRVIAIVGGGTGLIGDPSGKTEMRQVLTSERIAENIAGVRRQLERFLALDGVRGLMLDNADWLAPWSYIDFLREIGRHFSVNRMLAAESYKARLETGLNFIEFNYMLLQAYDFLHLYREHGCRLELGGSDQWGNIVAGIDLIRRVTGGEAYGLTFPLITTSTGAKMGKTAAGAVWLDPELLKPFDYYQYWVNVTDADVGRFLALFTFLPTEEVRRLTSLEGAELREAKQVLAFEATRICHGEKAAEEARQGAQALFSGGGGEESVPTSDIDPRHLTHGLLVVDLLAQTGLASSKSDARRKVEQGGAYVNDVRIDSIERTLSRDDFPGGRCMLRAGKKKHHRLRLAEG
ncbi:MAG: tyrosine--tRNA ligase [Planctomycetes bacterium]|nr:tyrosine--tRNA ligase [Planctomycetota bacterium]